MRADCACEGRAPAGSTILAMRAAFPALPRLLLALCGLASAVALAQKPAADCRATAPRRAKTGVEQKIERIHHEDAGSRIDELRVGGETKTHHRPAQGRRPGLRSGAGGQ